MLFDIVLYAVFVVPVIVGIIFYITSKYDKLMSAFFGLFLGLMFCTFIFVVVDGTTYYEYVDSCTIIAQQKKYYDVQKKRRDRLTKLLENFKGYPEQKQFTVTVNQDMPVSTIVEQLANVEKSLANTEQWIIDAERTKAKIEIGWFSNVKNYVSCNIQKR